MVRCFLWGMEMVSGKVVDFDELSEIMQRADENPAISLNHKRPWFNILVLTQPPQREPWSWHPFHFSVIVR